MTQPSSRSRRRSGTPSPRFAGSGRRRALVLGLCFGLGYGLVHRFSLLHFGDGRGLGGNQQFGVKAFPGTSLEELRKRSGASSPSVRADLEQIEQERRRAREDKEQARREAEIEQRNTEESDRLQRDDETARLEQLQAPAAPAAAPEPPIDSPLLSPPPPVPQPDPQATAPVVPPEPPTQP
ncbi:MAG: hypothetical protein ACK5IA_11250 [Cyanobacteriota bacterium]